MWSAQNAGNNIYSLPLSAVVPALIVALQGTPPAIRKLYVYINACGVRTSTQNWTAHVTQSLKHNINFGSCISSTLAIVVTAPRISHWNSLRVHKIPTGG
jgi:hypothetical protein